MLSHFIRRKDTPSPLGFAAALQPAIAQAGEVVLPVWQPHQLTTAASSDDTDRGAVPTGDQWTGGGDIEDRAGIEPGHIGGRGERLVISCANEIDNSSRAVVPIDAPVQGVAMPVEPTPRQILWDVGERL